MAINLKFDLMDNPEPPSIVLANRNGNKLGQLDVNVESIDIKDSMKTSEFTFTLNKYIDDKITPLWDKVVDFKLVYCPEWDLWYGIKVELDEATETVKTVFCTQLGQEELSQIKVYNTEINTEADIARDDYKISILYDEDNPDASILHRVMSKAPHYSVAYIDESLKRIQKSFSFDDASICDIFDEIEEEVGCLVVYNSNSDKNGMPKRDVSIYDLLQNCKNPNCKHRGEFTDKCPKCGGTDIDYGYGEDTTIFVTSDELATEGIQLVTDTDSVKNCFKLEAGDDLMTATIRNCNPNGSDYIWYFSDAVKEDMSKELVEAIENYDSKYKEYYDTHTSNLDENLASKYNALVEKYKEYYDTPSTCINCDYEGEFENECPSCHSGNILTGKSLQPIDTPITGYSALMNAYYNTIDLALYLESGLMPNVKMSDTTAEEQVKLLTSSSLSPVAVNVEKIDNVSLATANSAVLSMAKVIVRPTYKVEISAPTLSDDKIWSGQFIVTNYSDETDAATGDTVNVTINNETEDFIKQKIEKALKKENTDDLSISGLFDEDKYDYDAFCAELKKYALNPLKSFYDACDACLNILAEQGAGDKNEKLDLYENLYEPYYKRSQAIAKEIKLREDEIAVIKGIYDETDEDNKVLITKGLQTNIEDCQNEIQDALNFEEHLGENLWLELCSYRREDKYSNSNYVSDGLNNAELFEKALEFVEVAENEIFKSAELQHSISATLNNLLAIPKFKPLVKYFKTGNWIRVQVDGRIFKLRLLEYDFSYSDLESIPVEFSDVTKIKNGTTDVKDIISQAASMASSYDSVQRQAKKGNVARNTIDQWLVDGLNSANVEIKNNNSEEVLLTKSGLLARSYSDITGEYSPEQLKITHNIMAYTDDDWKTVRQAIGKHDYKFYNESEGNFADKTGYGMNADFVTAGVVSGSQIIGGDIYSNNYSKTVVDGETVTTGSYIDLEEGKFSLAGGKLTYDGGDLTIVGEIEVTTSGRIGCWDINGTSIYKDSAAFGDANGMYFGTKGLSLGDAFKVEPSGLATMTKANVSGTVTASDIIGGTITGTSIKGVDITAGSTLKVGVQKDEDGNDIENSYLTWISEDGVLNTIDANISGEIRAVKGMIGGFTIEPTKTEKGEDKVGGWLYSSGTTLGSPNSIFLSAVNMNGAVNFFDEEINDWRLTVGSKFGITSDGTVYTADCEITGGSLRMGNINDGYSAWISVEDGVLNANGVNIRGVINAVEGHIGGWGINSQALYATSLYSAGLCSLKEKYDSDVLTYELNDDTQSYKVTGCSSEAIRVEIPSYYNDLPVVTIAKKAFRQHDVLTDIIIGDNITSIEFQSFYGCSNLKTIRFSLNSQLRSIDGFAFEDCTSLTSVIIPDSVTSIGMYALSFCDSLTSIIIPDSVTKIGDYAFSGCTSLTICCEAASQPSGWSSNWNYSDCPVVWGYKKNYNHPSLVSPNDTSVPRVFAGTNNGGVPDVLTHSNFLVLEDGSLYAEAAKISGEINATSGSFTGEINATSGKIGELKIDNGIKGYVDNAESFSLTSDGLKINDDSGIIHVGKLDMQYVKQDETTYLKANGAVCIQGIESNEVITSIELMTDIGDEEIECDISLCIGEIKTDTSTEMEIYLKSSNQLFRSQDFIIEYQQTRGVIFGDHSYEDAETHTITLTIDTNATESSIEKIDIQNHAILNDFIRFRLSGNDDWLGDDSIWDIEGTTIGTIGNITQKKTKKNILMSGNITPKNTEIYYLGQEGALWAALYAATGTIQQSDKNKKNNINNLNYYYTNIFDNLKPVSYKLNNNTSNRTHIGFIAQDVKEAIISAGLTTQDFAGYCEWQDKDGNIGCGLRYEEFISLCVDQIQKLKKRVEELENKQIKEVKENE